MRRIGERHVHSAVEPAGNLWFGARQRPLAPLAARRSLWRRLRWWLWLGCCLEPPVCAPTLKSPYAGNSPKNRASCRAYIDQPAAAHFAPDKFLTDLLCGLRKPQLTNAGVVLIGPMATVSRSTAIGAHGRCLAASALRICATVARPRRTVRSFTIVGSPTTFFVLVCSVRISASTCSSSS